MLDFDKQVKTLTTDQFFWVTTGTGKLKPKKRAVIFIHGFGGSPEETWKAPDSTDSFYGLLAADPDLTDCNIYLFKYPTAKLILRLLKRLSSSFCS